MVHFLIPCLSVVYYPSDVNCVVAPWTCGTCTKTCGSGTALCTATIVTVSYTPRFSLLLSTHTLTFLSSVQFRISFYVVPLLCFACRTPWAMASDVLGYYSSAPAPLLLVLLWIVLLAIGAALRVAAAAALVRRFACDR